MRCSALAGGTRDDAPVQAEGFKHQKIVRRPDLDDRYLFYGSALADELTTPTPSSHQARIEVGAAAAGMEPELGTHSVNGKQRLVADRVVGYARVVVTDESLDVDDADVHPRVAEVH